MRAERIRRMVLEEWRGLPVDDRPDRFVGIGEALTKTVAKLGLTERLCEEQVRQAWLSIVGEFLATHSQPVGMQRGVLMIQVIQPSVRFELERTWKAEILKKLRARFGEKTIKEVRFR